MKTLSGSRKDHRSGNWDVLGRSFGLLQFVPDGTVLKLRGVTVAFLGGVETDNKAAACIDKDALARLNGGHLARSIYWLPTTALSA